MADQSLLNQDNTEDSIEEAELATATYVQYILYARDARKLINVDGKSRPRDASKSWVSSNQPDDALIPPLQEVGQKMRDSVKSLAGKDTRCCSDAKQSLVKGKTSIAYPWKSLRRETRSLARK